MSLIQYFINYGQIINNLTTFIYCSEVYKLIKADKMRYKGIPDLQDI